MRRLLFAFVIAIALGAIGYLVVPRARYPLGPPLDAPQSMSGDALRQFERWYEAQKRFTVPVSSDGAVVLIVKFTDYQCPGCAWTHEAAAPVLARWQARFPGALKFLEKQFPLNRDCNRMVSHSRHAAACAAAAAVVLSAEHAREKAMADWLYGNQERLTPAVIRDAASSVGLVEGFDGQQARALAVVTVDTQVAQKLGVSSTPTYFVNGVKMARTNKVMQPDELDAAIGWELKKAGRVK